uniref:Protein SDA1 n=1 Tax=Entomoneis paludosa TaxID=265537 RepID=A0A7S2YIE9_9STRA
MADKNSIDYHFHSKKTKAHARQVERQVKNRQKAIRKKEESEWTDISPQEDQGVEACKKLFPAIEMLRDPQGLAETVFKKLRSSGSIKYETKLLMMNFVTRLVGNHELLVLPLYPFLQKYMGGQQRNVTALLAYTVQACHEQVPPDEIHGILKTIAHNFIAERNSEEQMAVGINAARAICFRVPSVLSLEEDNDHSAMALDVQAFARDLAAYSNHRDRSVAIAGKSWTNFIRETFPGLLQGKHRGLQGTALHKSGTKPLRYGQSKVAAGVEGADLLAEYEAKKALKKRQGGGTGESDTSDDNDDSEGEWEEVMKGGDGEEAPEQEGEEEEEIDEEEEEIEGEEDEDEEAPTLVNLDKESGESNNQVEWSKMSEEDRDKLKQEMSANRIFSTKDFEKMRKLVARENRLKRDPREVARRKRAIARGQGEYGDLSDDSDSDEDAPVKISGAVNPEDIMANSRKKRQNKAERLEKALAGREKFEAKQRDGGSTNIEKKRAKNFLMTKYSREARIKGNGKGGLSKKRKDVKKQLTHEAKKRRRKV